MGRLRLCRESVARPRRRAWRERPDPTRGGPDPHWSGSAVRAATHSARATADSARVLVSLRRLWSLAPRTPPPPETASDRARERMTQLSRRHHDLPAMVSLVRGE